MVQIQACMYQYSRAIYRSIKDLVDPYVDPETRIEYRRQVLERGGSVDGDVFVRDFLGREPNNEAFLKNIGL